MNLPSQCSKLPKHCPECGSGNLETNSDGIIGMSHKDNEEWELDYVNFHEPYFYLLCNSCCYRWEVK